MAPEFPSVFVDADVIIAGSASTSGAAHLILRLGEFGVIDVVSSAHARQEATRNITLKLPEALPAFRQILEVACRWGSDPTASALAAAREHADPKDVPLLAAALEADCRVLVTFNTRHYRAGGLPLRVETPGDLVRRLRSLLESLAD